MSERERGIRLTLSLRILSRCLLTQRVCVCIYIYIYIVAYTHIKACRELSRCLLTQRVFIYIYIYIYMVAYIYCVYIYSWVRATATKKKKALVSQQRHRHIAEVARAATAATRRSGQCRCWLTGALFFLVANWAGAHASEFARETRRHPEAVFLHTRERAWRARGVTRAIRVKGDDLIEP